MKCLCVAVLPFSPYPFVSMVEIAASNTSHTHFLYCATASFVTLYVFVFAFPFFIFTNHSLATGCTTCAPRLPWLASLALPLSGTSWRRPRRCWKTGAGTSKR